MRPPEDLHQLLAEIREMLEERLAEIHAHKRWGLAGRITSRLV